jgi:ABC-type transporter Mla subunit MlaD
MATDRTSEQTGRELEAKQAELAAAATSRPKRTPEQIRQQLKTERAELVSAVADLRASIEVTRARVDDVKRKLPFIAAGATAAAFVVSSALGATFRLFAGRRSSTPGNERLRLGRWSVREDDE